jgi:hypothetical protein
MKEMVRTTTLQYRLDKVTDTLTETKTGRVRETHNDTTRHDTACHVAWSVVESAPKIHTPALMLAQFHAIPCQVTPGQTKMRPYQIR